MPTNRCPTCGEPLDPASSRCATCGVAADAPADTAAVAPTAAPPGSTSAPTAGLSDDTTPEPPRPPDPHPARPRSTGRAHAGAFPRELGHYRLLREIGHGGMGIVYEADDTRLVRKVALKTLFELEGGQRIRDRFLREARIAGILDHPNLVPVHDYGTIEGVAYYTMPLVSGLSLEDAIPFLHGRAKRDPPAYLEIPEDPAARVRLALRWFEGALGGLEHAHNLGIVHRDIKPSNLMLDAATGQLRLTDFGVARAHHLTAMTQQGALVGTVGYMSPEQIQRDIENVGPASDIYSMGVTLYRTLVDRLPYSASVVGNYLERIVSAPLELQGKGIPLLSRDLLTILEKSMEKSPGLRYSNARAFADDLGRFGRFEPITARPIGLIGRLTRWSRRKPAVATLASILLIAAVTVGVLFRIQHRASRVLRAQRVEASVVEGNYASLVSDYDKAIDLFGQAVDLDPEHLQARVGRAMALWEDAESAGGGDQIEQARKNSLIERALEDLQVAGSIRPDLSSVHLLRSRCLKKKGDEAGAQREEAIAASLPPQVALDSRLRGDIAIREGDCPTAVQHFDDAIERDPQSFWAILQRGACYLQSGNLAGARIDYEVATHLFPDHAFPHNNLANVLGDQGETEAALAEYRRALEIDPGSATIHFNYGESLRRSGKTEEAERVFRRSLEINPNLSKARNNLGVLLIETRREDEAIAQFVETIRYEEPREGRDAEELRIGYTNLCDAYLSRKDAAAAEKPCEKTVEMSPDNPISHYNLALYRMLTGETDGALDSLEKDVELGDTDHEYLLTDEAFAPLRAHPRFRALIRRMSGAAR